MKLKTKCEVLLLFFLCAALAFSCISIGAKVSGSGTPASQASGSYIKWMTFDVPQSALDKAAKMDVDSYKNGPQMHWIEVLAYLAAKYYGHWERYAAKDMDAVVSRLKTGETMAEIAQGMQYYDFYYNAYDAVLDGFIGEYKAPAPNGNGTVVKYGLLVYSPIAKGYYFSHYDDFGDSRTFGYDRTHEGNDLLGSVGTPIIAVESGYVECLGWNRYGGWRIGIRSFDKKRYYYYAHLRKNHPYVQNLKQGMLVKAGEVIGYLGMTGYSDEENVNNMTKPHLHFGLQLIFDESQKEGVNQIWVNLYDLVNFLDKNQSGVKKDAQTGDYYAVSLR